jgi:2-C-methyl-D-erythritol 4-phosphate cytidylyltransferase
MTDHRWLAAAPPSERAGVWSIVVAGGTGARFGGAVAKQYLPLGNARVIDWSLSLVRSVSGDRVVLVVAPDRVGDHGTGATHVVAGGVTRSESVRAGLAAVGPDAEIILVHDAARPFVPRTVLTRLLAAIDAGADAAVPGLAVTDTVKRVDAEGVVLETPDRAALMAVQTPQAFRADVLRRVHATGGEATDDAALVESSGGRVVVVRGDPLARKVTTDEDLRWLRAQLDATTDPGRKDAGDR